MHLTKAGQSIETLKTTLELGYNVMKGTEYFVS